MSHQDLQSEGASGPGQPSSFGRWLPLVLSVVCGLIGAVNNGNAKNQYVGIGEPEPATPGSAIIFWVLGGLFLVVFIISWGVRLGTSRPGATTLPTAEPSAAQQPRSIVDQLSELARLRREGLLTQQEYESLKGSLLEEL